LRSGENLSAPSETEGLAMHDVAIRRSDIRGIEISRGAVAPPAHRQSLRDRSVVTHMRARCEWQGT
jgi:hypothetical protein